MNWNSIRAALTTPTEVPRQGPRLRTNLDTDLLKLAAIVSMLIDHVGGAFFPEVGAFRWIGRLAFPIFCYCLTVGLLYTRNIKRYLGRLAVFAVVSQPFYVLASTPMTGWWTGIGATGTSSSPCFCPSWPCTG